MLRVGRGTGRGVELRDARPPAADRRRAAPHRGLRARPPRGRALRGPAPRRRARASSCTASPAPSAAVRTTSRSTSRPATPRTSTAPARTSTRAARKAAAQCLVMRYPPALICERPLICVAYFGCVALGLAPSPAARNAARRARPRRCSASAVVAVVALARRRGARALRCRRSPATPRRSRASTIQPLGGTCSRRRADRRRGPPDRARRRRTAQLTPAKKIAPGTKVTIVVTARRPGWNAWLLGKTADQAPDRDGAAGRGDLEVGDQARRPGRSR